MSCRVEGRALKTSLIASVCVVGSRGWRNSGATATAERPPRKPRLLRSVVAGAVDDAGDGEAKDRHHCDKYPKARLIEMHLVQTFEVVVEVASGRGRVDEGEEHVWRHAG